MNNQAMLITKVKNIYIMLLHAISKENISIVDHYLDDSLASKYDEIIQNNIKNNVRQVYRQPNISNLEIVDEDDEYIFIEGEVRYISYLVDRQTDKYVSGDNKTRITDYIVLKFRKNDVQSKILHKCPNCGASLSINTSGICSYCSGAIDERFSPYVLCSVSPIE